MLDTTFAVCRRTGRARSEHAAWHIPTSSIWFQSLTGMSRQDRSKNSNLSNVFKLIPIRLLFPIHFMFLLQLYLFFSLHLSSVALYSVFYTGCSTHFCIVVKCTYCFFSFLYSIGIEATTFASFLLYSALLAVFILINVCYVFNSNYSKYVICITYVLRRLLL